ncbi:hypothetical protein M5K25_016621 [Dendrobium thyrsiflorum]|uniref:Uncharacterized protein n=1 Tax=Dendrobium thyrsiflorum TaxID=117978 RepID=A0ABD0UK62_DENTH
MWQAGIEEFTATFWLPDHRLRPGVLPDHHLRPDVLPDHHLRPDVLPDHHLRPDVLLDHSPKPDVLLKARRSVRSPLDARRSAGPPSDARRSTGPPPNIVPPSNHRLTMHVNSLYYLCTLAAFDDKVKIAYKFWEEKAISNYYKKNESQFNQILNIELDKLLRLASLLMNSGQASYVSHTQLDFRYRPTHGKLSHQHKFKRFRKRQHLFLRDPQSLQTLKSSNFMIRKSIRGIRTRKNIFEGIRGILTIEKTRIQAFKNCRHQENQTEKKKERTKRKGEERPKEEFLIGKEGRLLLFQSHLHIFRHLDYEIDQISIFFVFFRDLVFSSKGEALLTCILHWRLEIHDGKSVFEQAFLSSSWFLIDYLSPASWSSVVVGIRTRKKQCVGLDKQGKQRRRKFVATSCYNYDVWTKEVFNSLSSTSLGSLSGLSGQRR